MGKQIYLTDKELDYLKSLIDAQDPHDMGDTIDPEIAHYETSRASISQKLIRSSRK